MKAHYYKEGGRTIQEDLVIKERTLHQVVRYAKGSLTFIHSIKFLHW